MKKLLIGLLTSLSLSMAHADNPNHFSGFFSRVNLGGMTANIKDSNQLHIVTLQPQNLNNKLDSLSPTLTNYALTGGLSFGYSDIFSSFLVGLDARVNFQSLEMNADSNLNAATGIPSNWHRHTSVNMKNDFALLVKLGILCQPNTLFYGLIGPSWGRFKTSYDATFSQGDSGTGIIFAGNIQDANTTYETGFALGLGIEHMITDHLSLGIEYDYSDYGTLDTPDNLSAFILQNGTIVNGQTLSISDDIQAKTNRVTLNLVYYFDKHLGK